ncbi:MAG: hypothetical protein QM831_14425 [Kofleriaceae bacterium]
MDELATLDRAIDKGTRGRWQIRLGERGQRGPLDHDYAPARRTALGQREREHLLDESIEIDLARQRLRHGRDPRDAESADGIRTCGDDARVRVEPPQLAVCAPRDPRTAREITIGAGDDRRSAALVECFGALGREPFVVDHLARASSRDRFVVQPAGVGGALLQARDLGFEQPDPRQEVVLAMTAERDEPIDVAARFVEPIECQERECRRKPEVERDDPNAGEHFERLGLGD